MESSPANQLPEAGSLPDGFVESSANSPSVVAAEDADYKDSFIDVDQTPAEKLQLDGGSRGSEKPNHVEPLPEMESSIDLLEVDDKPSESQPGDEKPTEPKESESHGDCKGIEGSLELHNGDKKKSCTAEYTERLKDQNIVSTDPKRKVVKRSLKYEKELLELTLMYQKVLSERDAAVGVRVRLESLCRELQHQNKMLMDECHRVSTEAQNMRQELSTKFSDAIKDISVKLEEQKNESLSQLKENDMLRNKLKHLADQYTLCEEQFSQKLKQKMLELQLADLKTQQQQERSTHEQTQMQLYAEQVTQLLATEKDLRSQLASDGEKFHQFQDALLKSNEVFETFKQEMEKMAKLTKEVKKENEFLKGKCEKSDFAIVRLIDEREQTKKQIEKLKNQKEKLESLCRSLQAERKQVRVESPPIDPASVQAQIDPVDKDP